MNFTEIAEQRQSSRSYNSEKMVEKEKQRLNDKVQELEQLKEQVLKDKEEMMLR